MTDTDAFDLTPYEGPTNALPYEAGLPHAQQILAALDDNPMISNDELIAGCLIAAMSLIYSIAEPQSRWDLMDAAREFWNELESEWESGEACVLLVDDGDDDERRGTE